MSKNDFAVWYVVISPHAFTTDINKGPSGLSDETACLQIQDTRSEVVVFLVYYWNIQTTPEHTHISI